MYLDLNVNPVRLKDEAIHLSLITLKQKHMIHSKHFIFVVQLFLFMQVQRSYIKDMVCLFLYCGLLKYFLHTHNIYSCYFLNNVLMSKKILNMPIKHCSYVVNRDLLKGEIAQIIFLVLVHLHLDNQFTISNMF